MREVLACLRSHSLEVAEPRSSSLDSILCHLPLHRPAVSSPLETPTEKATSPSHIEEAGCGRSQARLERG